MRLGLNMGSWSADNTDLLAKAREAGYRVVEPAPRPGAGGALVAFLHPKSTGGVLIELVEHGHA